MSASPANPPCPPQAASRIKQRARDIGFEAAGVARGGPLEARRHFEAWLAAEHHGEMSYLASARHRERRADPERVLPGIQSVVCVALCYTPHADPALDRRLGRIARYAVGEDYHRVMRDHLRAFERFVRDELPGANVLGYSDTGAILERGWAERAGLGWIGTPPGLSPGACGSGSLLGELRGARALEPDLPLEREHCGRCHRC